MAERLSHSIVRADGLNGQVVKVLEKTGLSADSFKAGDLVQLDSTGYALVATAANIFGIVRSNAVGTASTVHEVELLDPNGIYSVRYKASATAQALQGDGVSFVFTAGAHTVDESTGTIDAYIVAFDSRDAVTTSGGRVLIRFVSTLFDKQF